MFDTIDRFGSAVAVVLESGQAISYAELCRRADALVAELGPQRQLVVVECANVEAVLLAYVGLARAGHAAILATVGGGDDHTNLVRTFRPNAVFRLQKGGTYAFSILRGETIALHPDLSVLLSTSGSTGSAKLVRLSSGNLAANARSIAQYLGLMADDRAITALPMQYSYGLSVINSHLSVGASLLLTDRSIADPEFFAVFDRLGATNFQGVPHSFEILARSEFMDQARPGLRFFTQAGGRLSPDLVTRFAEYGDDHHARFFVMYGQTEATARMAYVPPEDLLANPGVIGQAIPGGLLTAEIDGQAVPDGEEGELVYRGPNVMMGYATRPDELALGPTLGALRTGDLAKRLPSGYFQITGRASRFIKLFGLRIGLDDVEDRLRELGLAAAATGNDEALVVALEGQGGRQRASAFIAERFKLPPAAFVVLELDALPHNANGKVDYPAIRALAAQATPVSEESSLAEQAAEILGLSHVDPSKSFVELGADSLSYVQFAMAIEEALGHLPRQWERIPIADLVAVRDTRPEVLAHPTIHHTPTDVVLRAVAIIGVCINHVFDNNIEGASIVLMALAGYSFARFQVPHIEGHGIRATLAYLLSRILLPYYVTIAILMAFFGIIYTPNLLLIYSFSPHDVIDDYPPRLIYFWFVEAYIFAIVLSSMLLIIPAVNRVQRRVPAMVPAALLFGFEVLRVVGTLLVDGPTSDTGINLFSSHGFIMVAPYFALGWLLFALHRQIARSAVVLAATALIVLFPTFEFNEAWLFLLVAMMALILVPSVPTGRRLGAAISLVAISSYYIYLEHIFVMQAMGRLFEEPLRGAVGVLAVLLCLALGITVQYGVTAIASWRRPGRWLGRRRADDKIEGQHH